MTVAKTFIVVIFLWLGAAVTAQTNHTEDIYRAYLEGDMSKWVQIIGIMDEEKVDTEEQNYQKQRYSHIKYSVYSKVNFIYFCEHQFRLL